MTQARVCYWHPERETGLRCSRCGRGVCVECMRQHPVGLRCKECAQAARLPTYQAPASYLARGIAAAVALGLTGGFALFMLRQVLPGFGFLYFLLMIGAGYVIGEGISVAVNRRRGRPYQIIALAATGLATWPFALAGLAGVLSFGGAIGGLMTLFGVGAAGFVAWSRLAP